MLVGQAHALLLALAVAGCGSSEGVPPAKDEVVVDAPAESTADVRGVDDVLPDVPATGFLTDDGDLETTTDTGGVADIGASDAPSDATASDTVPTSTWGCAESDKLCDCYDANLTAGYTQLSCVKTYPCCVRFSITKSGTAPYHGCDCYSDAYLASVGRSCAEQLAHVSSTPTYSDATTTASCPSS